MNTELRVVWTRIARSQHGGTGRGSSNPRAGDLLQGSNASGVIKMRVRVEN
jgi:hypothetical protein